MATYCLLDDSEKYRICNLNRNESLYTENCSYGDTHSRALSDGDYYGRGLYNESIGTTQDIEKRNNLMNKNDFNKNCDYGVSNC